MKYLITGYQVVYSNGCRDTIKLATPIATSDIENERLILKMKHKCIGINLTYMEL